MKCSVCGNEIKDSAKFCPYCGNNVQERKKKKEKKKEKKKHKYVGIILLILLGIVCAVGVGFLTVEVLDIYGDNFLGLILQQMGF